ncbi:alpha/beta hydrolase [Bradyrhizobium sp. 1]|uniref:alpha/beta hydrolase family protein n=1 Tax=Bradyrhizobium sp. 1 TaxID=241591 RepID=UPI001FF9A403|nr:alpha/beta hydrolase [Bradyrhizobium sp. 1]MCK1392598.1 alpha/beta hydrolase [Bradyrhizobium sp. 1]
MRRRKFISMLGCAAVAWPFASSATEDADFVIDGVPLPADARLAFVLQSGTDVQRRFSGVWTGAWNGEIKHILLVERIDEDGAASIVYALGDDFHTGLRANWRRLDATVSGRTLTVKVPGGIAEYGIDDEGQLSAFFKGSGVARATMIKSDLASLLRPHAVVAWSRGTSELLETDLLEDGYPIGLEVVFFKPPGSGPFPLAVFHHGSVGSNATPGLIKQTWVSLEVADFLNKRGWLVAFPQRRGRGKSGGRYEEEQNSFGDLAKALAGADRALTDIGAANAALRRRQDVSPGPVLVGGQSRGGALSIACAGTDSEQILGVINFVGGWFSEKAPSAALVNQALLERGAHYDRSTIWLYGQGDKFYSLSHSRKNFAAFERAGGRGQFVEFNVPSDIGHNVIHYPDLWEGQIDDYLKSVRRGN